MGLLLSSTILFTASIAIGAPKETQGGADQILALTVPAGGQDGFTQLPPAQTGLSFTNELSTVVAGQNQIRMNGSGVALGDVDGDGLPDIYLCRMEGPNALYRNLGGWKFEDITERSGTACNYQFSTGAALADVEGDGDLDLLVNGVGTGTRLFINDGTGKFTEDRDSGLSRRFGAMSIALADVDGDGDLDLYVCNYRTTTIRSTGLMLLNANGQRSVRPEDKDQLEIGPNGAILEMGEPDILYLNNGHGKFTPVSWTDGRFLDEDGQKLAGPPRDWGLTVAFRDINRDGWPDLYVCNDFHTPDRCWLNDGKGNFRALPKYALRNTSTFSMGVDFGDINRDGADDFILLDMLSPSHRRRMIQSNGKEPQIQAAGQFGLRPQFDRNTLQLNRGDTTFAEIAQFAGVEASGWAWSPVFLDVDLDGYEDLLLTTGNLFDTQDMDAEAAIAAKGPWPREKLGAKLAEYPRLASHNVAYHNNRNLTFTDASEAWGWNTPGISQGMALADLDGDGDLDVVVNRLNDAVGIYRNNSSKPRVRVRLKGNDSNRNAIGARVTLHTEGLDQAQEIQSGGRYLSCDAAERVFAFPKSQTGAIEVRWPNGTSTVASNIQPNYAYELHQDKGAVAAKTVSGTNSPALFKEHDTAVPLVHQQDDGNEFDRQPLLSKRLQRQGPAVAWADLDGDGWEDILAGGSFGEKPAYYKNLRNGQFARTAFPKLSETWKRDCTAVLGWPEEAGFRWISALSNYRDGLIVDARARWMDASGKTEAEIPQSDPSATGVMAMGDLDGDGVPDLFLGGRAVPGHYPAPTASHLMVRRGTHWEVSKTHELLLATLGLVTAAVWCDLNSDGRADLVVACEWGPIHIFINEAGQLADRTEAWGMAQTTGWWNCLAIGDFNGDGRMDVAAGNWGLNGPQHASREHPQRLFYGSLPNDDRVLTLDTEWDAERGVEVPARDLNGLATAWPEVRERFPTHKQFGEATLEQLLAGHPELTNSVQASTLESVILINQGNHFEIKPLPVDAQLSPARCMAVADFNLDGHDDLFIGQNHFATALHTTRSDAGRGLLLLGDGKGGWHTATAAESGIEIYGEASAAAVADFNHDGRPDLLVTQNGGGTVLLENQIPTRGVRVALQGSPGNSAGFGAVIRVKEGQTLGPAHVITLGNGSAGGDSPIRIMPIPKGDASLQVIWPGGQMRETKIPADATDIRVGADGSITPER